MWSLIKMDKIQHLLMIFKTQQIMNMKETYLTG